MCDRELTVSPSSNSLSLAREFTANVTTDDCLSTFLDKLAQVDDVCAHSVCEALYRSWHTLLSMYAVQHNANTFPSRREESTSHSNLLWAQIALDFTWSKLNYGHWKDVPLIWREAYATSALFKALGLMKIERLREALSELDKGIILGAPVFINAVKCFAVTLTREIQEIERNMSHGDDSFEPHMNVCQRGYVVGSHCVQRTEDSGIGKVVFRNYTLYHKASTHSVMRKVTTCQSCCDAGTSLCTDLSIIPLIDMTQRIAVVNCPSLEEFYLRYMMSSTSVVISGVMDHWPAYATRKWSLEYLKGVAGQRTVPVELGSRYTDNNWTQKLMTLNEFIDNHVTFNEKRRDTSTIGYLAQHQLFSQIPELKEDIVIPEYCYLESNRDSQVSRGLSCKCGESDDPVKVNAWFGPAGTVSPLHYDNDHNLLSQVVGRKYIRVYDKKQTPYLYPHEGLFNNTSQVDCEAPDMEKFPLFPQAVYSEFVLHPGQMLYIPPKYWHYVRALDISFSVSFWWT